MDVSCYWVSRSDDGGPSVRPSQMRDLARLNLELWFDVYFLGSGRDDEPGDEADRGDNASRRPISGARPDRRR